MVEGTITELGSEQIGVEVANRDDPVICAVVAGDDLSAFHVGDHVKMKCKLLGDASN